MDEEERFQQKRLGYIKCYIHAKHDVPLVQIKMNRSARQVSVDGDQNMCQRISQPQIPGH